MYHLNPLWVKTSVGVHIITVKRNENYIFSTTRLYKSQSLPTLGELSLRNSPCVNQINKKVQRCNLMQILKTPLLHDLVEEPTLNKCVIQGDIWCVIRATEKLYVFNAEVALITVSGGSFLKSRSVPLRPPQYLRKSGYFFWT